MNSKILKDYFVNFVVKGPFIFLNFSHRTININEFFIKPIDITEQSYYLIISSFQTNFQ